MQYSKDEIMQFAYEEDVKFIRLAFCDVFGKQKNISIMPDELPRAFEYGVAFDGSAIRGFSDVTHSDLLLHPDPGTLTALPWRPEQGRVVRMFSSITESDGTPFACDTRNLLRNAVAEAEKAGYRFSFGAEQEFYLLRLDEQDKPTKIPYDTAGYMDIAPEDRGENVRREICLTLEQMGIRPESSHHEEGPGQNEIDFRYSDALSAADDTVTFQSVVRAIAHRNGLHADFSAKPLENEPGNGFHINVSIQPCSEILAQHMIAGILKHIGDMTLFLNPTENAYARLGKQKAPKYITWSHENRSQLVRIPAAHGEYQRMELRSADPTANPYLAFTLLIYASLEGLREEYALEPAADFNLFAADAQTLAHLRKLPESLDEARKRAQESLFIRKYIPDAILESYCGK